MPDFDQSRFDQTSCLTYFVLYVDASKEDEYPTSDCDSNSSHMKAIRAAVKQYRQANETSSESTGDKSIELLLQLTRIGPEDYTATLTKTFGSVKTPEFKHYVTIIFRSRDG